MMYVCRSSEILPELSGLAGPSHQMSQMSLEEEDGEDEVRSSRVRFSEQALDTGQHDRAGKELNW